jgi:hypothetical protein
MGKKKKTKPTMQSGQHSSGSKSGLLPLVQGDPWLAQAVMTAS